jgi:hypothetical protein
MANFQIIPLRDIIQNEASTTAESYDETDEVQQSYLVLYFNLSFI